MMDIQILPLFPLNTVLFPGQTLPLHIFEPRYQQMVHDCIEKQMPFGVVLLRKGHETSSETTAQPFDVGTTCRIQKSEDLPDGLINIFCLGEQRFKINRLYHDHPYLTGEVELWPWTLSNMGEATDLIPVLKDSLSRYLETLGQAVGSPIRVERIPSDPLLLTSLAAIALRVPNRDKQGLLAAPSFYDLMRGCVNLLEHENRIFQVATAIPDVADELTSFLMSVN